MIRKMYVVPQELFDSLIRKSKITEDPLLTAQVEAEREKEQALATQKEDPDTALMKYSDAAFKENVLEEQRKRALAEPAPVKVVYQAPEQLQQVRIIEPSESFKKRTIPRTHGLPVLSKHKLLQQFYAYEPKMAREMIKQMAKTPEPSPSMFKTPRKSTTPKKRVDPVLRGIDVTKIPQIKQLRGGKEY